MIVCDSGPLLAVIDRKDRHHETVTAFFDALQGEVVVPSPIVAEVRYLIAKKLGPEAEVRFLDGILNGELTVAEPTDVDWARMSHLMRQYADFAFGVAHASVVAIAERFGVGQIVTIDRRHFRAVRPEHRAAFELVPRL